MKISVQFPMHTKSENELRSLPFAVANAPRGKQMGIAISIANKVKRQRAEVRRFLDSQLPRLRSRVPSSLLEPYMDARENFFRVTLIRISAGTLDTDGLHGALKAVRDEVAAWLGIDDSARAPASWRVGQQKGPPKVYAVRIEIEDDDPDKREVHRIVGPVIPKLGPIVGDCEHCGRLAGVSIPPEEMRAAVRAVKRIYEPTFPYHAQEPLVFRRAFYALPEEQDGAERVLRELDGLGENPPRIVRIRRKGVDRVLHRRLDHDPALGEHWIYEVAPSVAQASEERRAR